MLSGSPKCRSHRKLAPMIGSMGRGDLCALRLSGRLRSSGPKRVTAQCGMAARAAQIEICQWGRFAGAGRGNSAMSTYVLPRIRTAA